MPSIDIVIPAFNAEHCLNRTLEAAFDPDVPVDLSLGCIVVNNRSTDATAEIIARWADRGVRGVDHHSAQGRSTAVNSGVAASEADYVLVLDADCRLVGKNSLSVVNRAIRDHVAAGFGYATGVSDDFWGRYHRALANERMRSGWQGWTTQCCVVARDVFNRVGGFPTDYEYYGFEDRDFICRLRTHCSDTELRSLPDLQAHHDDDATLADVCRKMYVSGRHSSAVFRENFPDEYDATVYGRVDATTASAPMRLLLAALQPFRRVLRGMTSALLGWRHMPLIVGRPAVRLCSGLFYYRGTVDRNKRR
ncbi:MAG: glycosyltransferase [Gammaproteobacteria bacterium]|nr:glycosyltransferase [Gammaproteobacteria bacterium]